MLYEFQEALAKYSDSLKERSRQLKLEIGYQDALA